MLVLAVFAAAIWILRRLGAMWSATPEQGASGGSRRRSTGRRGEAVTELVRDRVCNTYVPKDRALRLEESGQVQYFCSEPCRSRHISRSSRRMSVA